MDTTSAAMRAIPLPKLLACSVKTGAHDLSRAKFTSDATLFRLRYVALTAVVLLAGPALAQSVDSVGTVTRLMPHQGDIAIFTISGPRTNSPACSTQGTEWALTLTTPTGRAMYAMLMVAATQNKTLRVVGWGTCLSWTQRAEPGWMQFEN
jgi:hypothetical protein